jgi:hypothetical protein
METGATAQTVLTPGINCQALLDTGPIAGDFINNYLLLKLNGRNHTYKTIKPLKVCIGLDNHCLQSTDVIDILVEFLIEDIKSSFTLTCHITSSGPINLIIGRECTKKYDLVTKLPQFFFNETKSNQIENITLSNTENENRLTHLKILPCVCDTISKPAANDSIPNISITPSTSLESHHHRVISTKRRVHFNDTPLIGRVFATLTAPNDAFSKTHSLITEVLGEPEQFSRTELIGADEIDDEIKDMFSPFIPNETSNDENDFLTKIVIEGDAELQNDIRKLCVKYKSIFRNTTGEDPANIPPFDLDVDLKKWEQPRNRLPVRPQ